MNKSLKTLNVTPWLVHWKQCLKPQLCEMVCNEMIEMIWWYHTMTSRNETISISNAFLEQNYWYYLQEAWILIFDHYNITLYRQKCCVMVWHKAKHPTGAWRDNIHLWACPKCCSTMAKDLLGVGKFKQEQNLSFNVTPWHTV
jgi:hypothetical protein